MFFAKDSLSVNELSFQIYGFLYINYIPYSIANIKIKSKIGRLSKFAEEEGEDDKDYNDKYLYR